ncbi:DUF4160 domain-containing protein [Synechococcus sp. CBW1107]|uniref:DUF4160 domain-containing protein n=1 Tax=unclassified Synechococcus TaxID=2626047 RepID=UPI003A0FB9BE
MNADQPKRCWKDANSHCRRTYTETGVQYYTCHQPSSGIANFWLSPTIELACNIGLSSPRIKEAERLVETRQQEIIDAWNNHFRN